MAKFHYGSDCYVPAIPGEPALELRDLTYTYPGEPGPALRGVELAIQPGEKVALIGPNGAGKSTLIQLVSGLKKLQQGAITIYGNVVGDCHHRVAYVPQRNDVDWSFPVTVRQVVMMGRYAHLGWLKRPRPGDEQAVETAMRTLDITGLADKQIGELSGGQQQRVMIARSLAQDADLLLLDEPLNNLDMSTQEQIFHVLEDLTGHGKTIIVSTHDLGLLPIHFERAVFLDGHIVADGPVAQVLTATRLAGAYGFKLCIDEDDPLHLHEHHAPLAD